MIKSINQLIGYEFRQQELASMALTHRSFGANNNERLEYLGDSLLNFIIGSALYEEFPDATEGKLSRLRSELVKGVTLASVARELQLGSHLKLGQGERKTGGSDRESILEDAVEALIGAIYLDAGIDVCRTIVLAWFQSRLDALKVDGQNFKDSKSQLQELLQAKQLALPEYKVVEINGKAHSQAFIVTCHVAQMDLQSQGEGRSRKIAEQNAARALLEKLAEEKLAEEKLDGGNLEGQKFKGQKHKKQGSLI